MPIHFSVVDDERFVEMLRSMGGNIGKLIDFFDDNAKRTEVIAIHKVDHNDVLYTIGVYDNWIKEDFSVYTTDCFNIGCDINLKANIIAWPGTVNDEKWKKIADDFWGKYKFNPRKFVYTAY